MTACLFTTRSFAKLLREVSGCFSEGGGHIHFVNFLEDPIGQTANSLNRSHVKGLSKALCVSYMCALRWNVKTWYVAAARTHIHKPTPIAEQVFLSNRIGTSGFSARVTYSEIGHSKFVKTLMLNRTTFYSGVIVKFDNSNESARQWLVVQLRKI